MFRTIRMMFLLMSLLGHTPAQIAAASQSAPDPAVLKAADGYLAAVLARDPAAVAALYQEDGIEMPPFVPPIVGRKAIEKYLRDLFTGPVKITTFTFAHRETTAAGNVAYDIGTYRQTFSRGPAGSFDESGKYVVILKRASGAWRASYVIYNSDRPPMSPPAPPSR